jgi:hypothetical protein
MAMTVTEIWRYPVKTMASEPRIDGSPWNRWAVAGRFDE